MSETKKLTFWMAYHKGSTYMGSPPRTYGRTKEELLAELKKNPYWEYQYGEPEEGTIEYTDEFDLMLKARRL